MCSARIERWRTSWPFRHSGRGAALCTDEWGAAPAFSSRALSLHRVLLPLRYLNTQITVVPAWLFHSHSTAQQAAIPRFTLSLRCHATNATLGPPQAPRHGQMGTLSLHYLGSSSLTGRRVFGVVCVHYTEHVAHGAVSTTSRGWPLSCANAGHTDIRALIVPLAP